VTSWRRLRADLREVRATLEMTMQDVTTDPIKIIRDAIRDTPGTDPLTIYGNGALARALAIALVRSGIWKMSDARVTALQGPFVVNLEHDKPFRSALNEALHFVMYPISAAIQEVARPHASPTLTIERGALSAVARTLEERILNRAADTAEANENVRVEDTIHKYGSPFIAREYPGKIVCCPGCGTAGKTEIGRSGNYSPRYWTARPRDQLLQCESCVGLGRLVTDFADAHVFTGRRGDIMTFDRIDGGQVELTVAANAVSQAAVVMEQRSKKMSKKTLKEQGKDLGGAAGLGLAMGATNQSGEILIDMIKALFKGNLMVEAALEDEMVRELSKAALALMLYSAAENAPGMMPKPEAIAKIAKLQVTWSTAKLSNETLAQIRPLLMKLAEVGDNLPAVLTEGSKGNDLDEAINERVRERELVER
jgi:hypothetical protein